MDIIINNRDNDKIIISEDVIASIVGIATTQTAGIAGMISKNKVKDGVFVLLKKESFSKGVIVDSANNKVKIDVYVAVRFGTNIQNVCKTVQESISFNISSALNIDIEEINVHVAGIASDPQE